VVRLAAPNLVAGNTIILKHASNCPQSALAFAQIMKDAGLPHDCYLNVFADNDQIQMIIGDERIRGASLTGSEGAGAAVASGAGRHLMKSTSNSAEAIRSSSSTRRTSTPPSPPP